MTAVRDVQMSTSACDLVQRFRGTFSPKVSAAQYWTRVHAHQLRQCGCACRQLLYDPTAQATVSTTAVGSRSSLALGILGTAESPVDSRCATHLSTAVCRGAWLHHGDTGPGPHGTVSYFQTI